jgi:hypothetical protein
MGSKEQKTLNTIVLDNRFIDSDKVVSLTHRQRFAPQEDFWHSFPLEAVDSRAILWLEGLGQLRKFNDLIGNRTRDLPACSTVPQPTALQRAPNQ